MGGNTCHLDWARGDKSLRNRGRAAAPRWYDASVHQGHADSETGG